MKYRHLLPVPGRLAARPSAGSINARACACLRDGKVNGCNITHVRGDLVSGALILERLNNCSSLWAGLG